MRALALPTEHGGWGFILEAILLGLIVVPSLAGLMIGAGGIAAFLTRHPLKLAAADRLRGRVYPRTRVCIMLALAYGSLALSFLIAAVAIGEPVSLLLLVAGAGPAAIQFSFDARNRGRKLLPELSGTLAVATLAAAVVLVGGGSMAVALTIAALCASRAVPTIFFVRSVLGKGSRTTSVILHGAAVAASAALLASGVAPATAAAAMTILFVRAVLTRPGTPAKVLGIRELAYGVAFVLSIGMGY